MNSLNKFESEKRVALITGVTGQDGSYLTELLLGMNYDVWGVIRRSSNLNTMRIDHIYDNPRLTLKYGDLTDSSCFTHLFADIKQRYPKLERLEVYNLGAMSHVKVSFELPEYTGNVDALGTLRILEAIRCCELEYRNKIRFYQASTSEMYGKVVEIPQTETTPFHPQSPYGIAKLYAHEMTKLYRNSYNLFTCAGILQNHESERRGVTFVTRKITRALGMILSGKQNKLVLGNLDALRDWGYSPDYVYGMWLMMQQDKPDDYVLATGEQHSVREFVEIAFKHCNFNIIWKGKGTSEIGYDKTSGRELVFISDKYFRPSEVDTLLGDASKAYKQLGWKPTTSFSELVKKMVDHDLDQTFPTNDAEADFSDQ
jgi:GDPmannose 4,6-dehydratase